MKNKGELILLFSLNDEQLLNIKYIVKKMGLRSKIIRKEDYNQSVGYLCNNPDFNKIEDEYLGNDFEKPMIVLKGFDKKRLDSFFDTIKTVCKTNNQIIKAVVTDINKSWSAEKLFNTIYNEHKLMADKEN